MSVQTFGEEELVNLGAVIIRAREVRWRTPDSIHRVAVALAKVSEANCACFNDRYAGKGAGEKPVRWEVIEEGISGVLPVLSGADLQRAFTTASLLHYNCDDQGGDFTLKIEGAHAGLIYVLEGVLEALGRKAGLE